MIFCLCGGTALAQLRANEDLGNRIDAIAKQLLSRHTAGVSIAVARDGRLILARGYGLANVEHSVTVTPETVFHIASISKNILAAVVLQLVDEGKLRLDDDVTKYMPEAPTQGHHVTVRQLLNHSSGIYSFTSLPNAADNERLELTHEQVLALIKDKPFDFEPGTRWRYDNSAFYLAGMVVERVTKQEYGAYVREHVFKPLGMTSASLCYARMVVPHLASGYEVDGGALVNAAFMTWKLPFAGGAVCATASDLLKWEEALDTGRVLTPSSLAVMRTPTMLADGTQIDYGLGTRLGSLDGHRVLGHTGGRGGFRPLLESFPDDHLTIVILVNMGDAASPSPVAVAPEIARAALGLKKNALLDLAVPSAELTALSGKYDSDEGPVEIFAGDGKLHFRIPGTHIEGVLRRQAENAYAIDDNKEARFVVRRGRAEWIMVYDGGLLMDAKYQVN
ncbi:MAG TPA: serine hydrolase domain-containing protein [Pyrinomonadaceae bacterium]|nr:serine hydrolase domain-containing protein [Pyrinomonadaceae bacterium]